MKIFFLALLLLFSSKVQAANNAPSFQGVTPHLFAAVDSVSPGEPFDIYLVLDLDAGWHAYSKDPGPTGFPPSIKWDLPQGWRASALEFSLPQQFSGPDGLPFLGYEKQALMRTRITPPEDLDVSKKSWKLEAHVSWLVCSTSQCVPGSAVLSVVVGDHISPQSEQSMLAILANPEHWSQAVVPILAQPLPKKSHAWILFLALASGVFGGFILNLMPCVLPVISLKIFGFISQAGESRAKILKHGLAFVAGIYLWFLLLGFLVLLLKASGKQVTWAFQFQSPAFLVALSVLVFLFALNLFGVFEMTLPSRAGSSLDKISSQSGYLGSFFQGLFATLLATPCTAPFLGSALGFAFAQSGRVILAMFFAIATGMAFPYLMLSVQPGWMKWLPRPGAWMERVKQLMGFPLLATNLWLLSILGAMHGASAIMMTLLLLLLLGCSCWIYGSFLMAQQGARRVALLLSILLAAASLWYCVPKILIMPSSEASLNKPSEASGSFVSKDTIPWVPYSAARLEELRASGKAVFLDFTAAWCLTCQFNERTAINTQGVRKLLQEEAIVPMKADWTNANPEITEALRGFGRVGVPFYVFYPASHSGKKSEPITFSELLTESQLIKVFTQH